MKEYEKRNLKIKLRNIQNNLKLLDAVEHVKVTSIALMGGNYKLELSLVLLSATAQEELLSMVEDKLKIERLKTQQLLEAQK